MPRTVHFQQAAMASLFEAWLLGDDPGHLRAVAQLLQEEIIRLEQLMSRFDPRAELARLNREGQDKPVRIERELFAILQDCRQWYNKTEHYFDIGINSPMAAYPGLEKALFFSKGSSQVEFLLPGLSLDLGGYGKGYALDCLGEILKSYGVFNYLLHGGKSSFLARGTQADGKAWEIKLAGEKEPYPKKYPVGTGFSFSGVFHDTEKESDIVHTPSEKRLSQDLSCAVRANTALEAEVWSTALLAMGKEYGEDFLTRTSVNMRVQYVEKLAI